LDKHSLVTCTLRALCLPEAASLYGAYYLQSQLQQSFNECSISLIRSAGPHRHEIQQVFVVADSSLINRELRIIICSELSR
jgi:hypothetical protein